jgi:hypothetical protein
VLLGPLADVGAHRARPPPSDRALYEDERIDAHDGVVDVLELVAEREPGRSGTVSRSQAMTLPFMGSNMAQGVLSAFAPHRKASLRDLSRTTGTPGKADDIDGADVEQ